MTGVAHANNERGPVVVRTRPRRHILSLKIRGRELGCRHRKFRAGLRLKQLRLALTVRHEIWKRYRLCLCHGATSARSRSPKT